MEIKYIHTEDIHNFIAPKVVVPILLKLLEPNSVVDVGCGIGTWLKVFQDFNVYDVLGIDGEYVKVSQLKIKQELFKSADLENNFSLNRKFDLAISLEVAEHLKPEAAEIFIDSLTNLSDNIFFSAAIPLQGGQNHVNEQPPKYWIDKFKKRGYKVLDVIRPLIWDSEEVDSWYIQNAILFSKNEVTIANLKNLENFEGRFFVHPKLAMDKYSYLEVLENENNKIKSGKKSIRFYFKVFLILLKGKL